MEDASCRRSPLAVATLIVLLSSLWLRTSERSPVRRPFAESRDACYGITALPAVRQGLVCVSSPEVIMDAAVALLGLPKACESIALPEALAPGSLLTLGIEGGGCRLDGVRRMSGKQALVAGFSIDINTSTAPDLVSLPGVGPAKARAIVEFRERNGPFRSAGDLVMVKGIGRKTVDRLTPWITANATSIGTE